MSDDMTNRIAVRLRPKDGLALFRGLDDGGFGWSLEHAADGAFHVVVDGVQEEHVVHLNPDGTWHVETVLPVITKTE